MPSRSAGKALAEGGVGPEEEGWLDEGSPTSSRMPHGFAKSNIDYRVSAFLSRPERYRLVVDDYYAADLFRSHGNRGATYLFLRWCVDRYGPGLLDALIRSDLRGLRNLEEATGSSFADLFRKWTVALYLSGLDPSESPEGPYRSIDPPGELEDWILAGPRTSVGRSRRPGRFLVGEGTTAHYAIDRGLAQRRGLGSRSAVLRRPRSRSRRSRFRPDLGTARAVGPTSSTARMASVRFRAEISRTGRHSGPARCPRLGTARADPGRASRRIPDAAGWTCWGSLPSSGPRPFRPRSSSKSEPIRSDRVRAESDGPMVFKAVGTDAKGRSRGLERPHAPVEA